MIGEAYRGVDGYVAEADLGLGCGLPTEVAGLAPGQTVVDLGAGAGNDAFIARRIVGERGRIIGVDMTQAMVAKARLNAQRMGYGNVEFLLGELERLPLPEGVADVVLSNCVFNLVPDKAQAFREVLRILKPGGHFSISDIVSTRPLPARLLEVAALYTGCVAGALPLAEYLRLISETGFVNVELRQKRAIDIPDAVLEQHLSGAEFADWRASGLAILSVTLWGERPGGV
jgi:ubiquinone/menaquinone biosynthesis C-methylase UbiE